MQPLNPFLRIQEKRSFQNMFVLPFSVNSQPQTLKFADKPSKYLTVIQLTVVIAKCVFAVEDNTDLSLEIYFFRC